MRLLCTCQNCDEQNGNEPKHRFHPAHTRQWFSQCPMWNRPNWWFRTIETRDFGHSRMLNHRISGISKESLFFFYAIHQVNACVVTNDGLDFMSRSAKCGKVRLLAPLRARSFGPRLALKKKESFFSFFTNRQTIHWFRRWSVEWWMVDPRQMYRRDSLKNMPMDCKTNHYHWQPM